MRIPDIELESACYGNWIDPADLEPVIETQAESYYRRYATQFIGDEDDLKQVARLAVWQLCDGQERVRELLAYSAIRQAIAGEIKATQRCGYGMLASQDIDWRLLAVPDHQLTDTQAQLLNRFRYMASLAAGFGHWEVLWLLVAAEWEPVDISQYIRSRVNNKNKHRRYLSPDRILKIAKKATDRIRKKLDPDLIVEVNNVSQMFWGTGQDTDRLWSVGKPEGW